MSLNIKFLFILCLVCSVSFSQSPCVSGGFASTDLIGANQYPYFSPSSGISVSTTHPHGTYTGPAAVNLDCIAFFWHSHSYMRLTSGNPITINFSVPVSTFSITISNCDDPFLPGNEEEIYFDTPSSCPGSITLSNFCSGVGWSTINGGKDITWLGPGVGHTVITVTSTIPSSTFIISHNGKSAGALVNLIDCFDTLSTASVGPVCSNIPPFNLNGSPSGGIWSGTGIIDTMLGTFDPAIAGTGTHVATYTTMGTCAGIQKTNVLVENGFTNTVSTISGCDSIQVNSHWYYTSQTVRDTFSGSNGCDSIINTPIVINLSSVGVPTNAAYCHGDMVPTGTFTSIPTGATFSWTNDNPSIGLAASGADSVPTFTAVNNTSTPIIANITVTPTLNGCVGTASTYSITVNPIPDSPTAADMVICPNNTTTLTATAPGGTYEWYDSLTGGTLLITNASYTTPVLSNDTIYFVQTTVSGCTSSRELVNVTMAPTLVVDAGLNNTTCLGDTYTLEVTPNGAGYSHVWDEPTNMGFSMDFDPTVSPLATTTYTATVTDPTGCTGSDTVQIVVNPIPTVSIPTNTAYCHGDIVPTGTFSSTPMGGTFSWTNDNPTIGLAASGADSVPTFTAVNNTSTPIIANVTVTSTLNGCIGTASTYSITVNPIPDSPTAADMVICPNTSTILTATAPGGAYEWYDNPTGGTLLIVNASYTTPLLSNDTIFFVQTTINSCTSSRDSVNVTMADSLVVNAGVNDTICLGDTYTLVVTPNGVGYSYVWDEPTNMEFSMDFDPTVSPSTTTTYTATVTDPTGCMGSDTVQIVVNPIPTISIPTNTAYCHGDMVPTGTFSSTPMGGIFSWTNDIPAIGLAASGTDSVPTFTAVNNTSTPIIANITVTPTLNGCVGTASTYTIVINPVPTLMVPTGGTYCVGDIVPKETFTSIPTGGTFSWINDNPSIGLSAAGVDSVPTFIATNSTTSPLAATISVIPTVNSCVGASLDYTIIINPTPTVTVPTGGTYCVGDIVPTETFTSIPFGGVFSWSNSNPLIGLVASGTDSVASFTTINSTASPLVATISVTPTVNSCVGISSDYTITINPTPTVVVPSDTAYCHGDTVPTNNFVSVPVGGTFSWTNSNNSIGLPISGSGNTPVFTATNNAGTPITSSIIVTPLVNGCVGTSSSFTIDVNPIPPNPVASGVTICPNNTANLMATSPGGTYAWFYEPTGGVLLSTGSTYITPSLSTGDTYYVQSTINGCTSSRTAVVVSIVPPLSVVASADLTICSGDSANISAMVVGPGNGGPYTFTWNNGLPSGPNSNYTVYPLDTTTYIVTLDDGGCSLVAQDSITVFVNPLPTVGFSTSMRKLCEIPQDTLTFITNKELTDSTITWNLGDGTIVGGLIADFDTINHSYFSAGNYDVSLTVTSTEGCSKTLTEIGYIDIYLNPIADFIMDPNPTTLFDPTINFFDQTVTSSLTSIASYEWDFGGLDTSNMQNPTYTFPENDTGQYMVTLTVIDQNGCVDVIEKNVVIIGDYGVYVPNAFTPNGNGKNDVFHPLGYGILERNYTLLIFNRWGEIIFEGHHPEDSWDGTFKNKKVTKGVYVWKLTFTDINNKIHSKIGHVSVIK